MFDGVTGEIGCCVIFIEGRQRIDRDSVPGMSATRVSATDFLFRLPGGNYFFTDGENGLILPDGDGQPGFYR